MAGPNNPFHKSIFKFQFCPVMIKIIHNSKLSVLLASKWENFWNSISEFCRWEELTSKGTLTFELRGGRSPRSPAKMRSTVASSLGILLPSWFFSDGYSIYHLVSITLSPYGRHSRRLNVSLHIFRRAVGGWGPL